MLNSVERRRFEDVYLISKRQDIRSEDSLVVMTDVIALQKFFILLTAELTLKIVLKNYQTVITNSPFLF